MMTQTERPMAALLATAAATAGYAPSIHNTQPWRWRVQPDRLELYAERDRQLAATDPDGRLLMLSCGVALHHARLALAAEGLTAQVRRLPDPAEPDLLAVIVPTGRTTATGEAMRLVQTMELRHTDRRPVGDEPVPDGSLAAIGASVDVLSGSRCLARSGPRSRGGCVACRRGGGPRPARQRRARLLDEPRRTGRHRPTDGGAAGEAAAHDRPGP